MDIKYFRLVYIGLILVFFSYNLSGYNGSVLGENNSDQSGSNSASILTEVQFPDTQLEGGVRKITNIKYVNDSEESKTLDLFLPEKMYTEKKYPLIIYIHGGAWLEGSKDYFKDYRIVKADFIVASVDYRLSGEDLFPAQIHDIKAALRWLRKNSTKFYIDTSNIGAYGESAGGHLALLLGTTSDIPELNGNIGYDLSESTDVKAVVSEYGITNLASIAKQCEENSACITDYRENGSIIGKLLGCYYNECGSKLNQASPINYLTPDDASINLFHSKKDSIVPYEQSVEFYAKASEIESLNIQMSLSENGAHIDGELREKYLSEIIKFFSDSLK